MFNIADFFTKGPKNTVKVSKTSGLFYSGSWKQIFGQTLVERWNLSEFSSVDYTIVIDLDREHKEIIKCLITGTSETANLVVYARNNTTIDLVQLSALVNETSVEFYISPKSEKINGAKFSFTGNYFPNMNV